MTNPVETKFSSFYEGDSIDKLIAYSKENANYVGDEWLGLDDTFTSYLKNHLHNIILVDSHDVFIKRTNNTYSRTSLCVANMPFEYFINECKQYDFIALYVARNLSFGTEPIYYLRYAHISLCPVNHQYVFEQRNLLRKNKLSDFLKDI